MRSLSGEWQGHKVFFDFDAASGAWYGFAGVGLDTSAGSHQLKLNYTFANGARSSSTHFVTIGRATYRRIALSVPRKFTEPDTETLERIKQEQELKRDVFHHLGKDRLWGDDFSAPVDNVITEHFGTQRTFNGKLQSVHQGLDFRAAAGTPVRAMNSGEVILARELFFEGGFVVIDHGQGLLTLYMHLSGLNAKEGDRVVKGQIVGLSGASGRATGPHLHVGARWQGVYVDPMTLLELKLP
ncbi:MAG: M23 family metallopeptidase [Blastocatellia bacterium]